VSIDETVQAILDAETWAQRIAQIRLVPQRHGTGEHVAIFAEVARRLYVPYLAPDFAFIHEAPFYDRDHFFAAYDVADALTERFSRVDEAGIAATISRCPTTLLVFRTLLGLTKNEFAHSTVIATAGLELEPLSGSQIDNLEKSTVAIDAPMTTGARKTLEIKSEAAAVTISAAMEGRLFGPPPPGHRNKQSKPDTERGWEGVRDYAENKVPFEVFLHQRHYGGAFRQVLDAASSRRGDLIENAVESLFLAAGVSFIRTGSHNQGDIERQFEITVAPAPDFVVFDPYDNSLKAMLECKGANDGGTARDKALRFRTLRAESIRLGGVPLFAVLGGIGWARINDALGPVVRDTDGRVFTLSTLQKMMEVAPFPQLVEQPFTPGA
jgi:hypothetical protein